MMLDDLRVWVDARLGPWAKAQGLDSLPDYTLEEPPGNIDADAACNLALLMAKPLRKSPRAVAQDLLNFLKPEGPVEAITIAGAGFLNFKWTLTRLHQELADLLKAGERYGRLPSDAKTEKILIEFVSANPTGPLHVGHGRGAALGDSLALILAHLGHQVTREYYINDAGNQVQLLGESVLARVRELHGKPLDLPAEGYHGDYIKDVAKDYVAQGDGAELDKARDFALSRLQKVIEKDLADFGVQFDSWFSERSLVTTKLVEKHIEALRSKGFVEESEGAVWFVAPGEKEEEKDKNRVLKKRDGRWTYFATDIAYHADKFERGFDRLVDLWGADHHGYVPRVKGSMQALGYDPNRLHILLYQLVSLSRGGVPVSMSKRSGDFITLREVLAEVGKDACRFFFAMRSPNTAFEFDLELAKKQTADNPVYYLQYAHARICSIFRQASPGLRPPSPSQERGVNGPSPVRERGRGEAEDFQLLKEQEERDLIKRLGLFPLALQVCAQEDSPHPLANYLLSLCRQFHHFYDHHRVLGDDPALTRARLALIQGVRQTLKVGLNLLGVSAPESM